MAEWRDGGMAGWRDGVTYPAILRYRKFSQMIRGMAERRNGMAEWYGGTATYQLHLWYMPMTTTPTPFNLIVLNKPIGASPQYLNFYIS